MTSGSETHEVREAPRSWLGRIRLAAKRLYQRIVRLDDTAHSIALGSALGFFIAMTPTYGVQVVITLLICTALRVNRVAAVIAVHATNPVTIIPAYWLDYKIGAHVLGQEAMTWEMFRVGLEGITEAPILDALRSVLALGWGILAPLVVGGVIFGGVCGAASYPVLLVLTKRVKEKGALRRARRKMRMRETRGEEPGIPAGTPERWSVPPDTIPPPPKVSGGNGSGDAHDEDLPEADRSGVIDR